MLDTSGALARGEPSTPRSGSPRRSGRSRSSSAPTVGGRHRRRQARRHLSLESDDDDVRNNKTHVVRRLRLERRRRTSSFAGETRTATTPTGDAGRRHGQRHACARAQRQRCSAPTSRTRSKISCDIVSGGPRSATPTLPPELETLHQRLRARLDAAAEGRPADPHQAGDDARRRGAERQAAAVGNALDAGANVVGAFNNNVVTPFNELVQQTQDARWIRTATATSDAYRPPKLAQTSSSTTSGRRRRRTCCSTRTASAA